MYTLVIGLGVSGKAAQKLLLSCKKKVIAIDDRENRGDEIALDKVDQVVISPGVSLNHPLVVAAKKQKIEVLGEAELAFRYLDQFTIGITGTNGKTTVTSLIHHVLTYHGRRARALGNIGDSLSEYVLDKDLKDILVVELSSYQLETMSSQSLDIALVLNITPDHLDRYPSMKEYVEAKSNIQFCIKPEGTCYLQDVDDEHLTFFKKPFQKIEKAGFEEIIQEHDRKNTIAAYTVCHHIGITKKQFIEALPSFRKPSHRVEFVTSLEGVDYYDDSKGTNIDAVKVAVKAMKGSVVLIAGGVHKGASYSSWISVFQNKVKHIILIGQAAIQMKQELQTTCSMQIVDSLEEAVKQAKLAASSGDSVLLSPGCSSFDMFRDYVHRGEEFKKIVTFLGQRSLEKS